MEGDGEGSERMVRKEEGKGDLQMRGSEGGTVKGRGSMGKVDERGENKANGSVCITRGRG